MTLWSALRLGVEADLLHYLPAGVMRHAARRIAALGQARSAAALLALSSLRAHAADTGQGDPLFCLSHRWYLARGLTTAQRVSAALCHYRFVEHRLPAILRQQIEGDGLELWRAAHQGHRFDIRLRTGRDVAYEGGLSVELRLDETTLSVLSFSILPSAIFGLPDASCRPETIFVSRKQTGRDDAARRAFDKAFDRCNPANLTFAALAAVASYFGHDRVLGIAAEKHPSWDATRNAQFQNSYSAFWETMDGRPDGAFGHMIALPVRFTSLDALDAAKRARALRRRGHIQSVTYNAALVLSAYRLSVPETGTEPLAQALTAGT